MCARERRDPPQRHAGRLGIDEQHAQPVVLRRRAVGADVHEDRRVRQAGARAPHLLPVHHEVVATVLGDGAQRGRVGAGIGLADRDGVVAAAAHDLGREPRPLLVGAPLVDRERRDQPPRVAHRDVEAGVPELLGDEHELERRRPRAAELRREGRPNRSISASAFWRASGGVDSSSHAFATSGGQVRATRSPTVLRSSSCSSLRLKSMWFNDYTNRGRRASSARPKSGDVGVVTRGEEGVR